MANERRCMYCQRILTGRPVAVCPCCQNGQRRTVTTGGSEYRALMAQGYRVGNQQMGCISALVRDGQPGLFPPEAIPAQEDHSWS